MASNKYIASLDIGTDKIALLVADVEDDDSLSIIANSICPSEGVKKGEINSIDALSRVLVKLLDQMSSSYGFIVDRFNVNLSDTHLTCSEGKAQIPVDGLITKNDIELVIDNAKAGSTPTNKEKLHVIPKKFTVDQTNEVVDPIDMEAEVLESKVHIVTVSSTSVRNIENCLKQSKLEIGDIVLNPISKSNALLSQDEKDHGVCLIDIGAGVTSYSVFHEEGIVRSGIIPMGGDEITQDIAYAFDTSFEEAKRLKENFGVAKSSTINEDSFISFSQAKNKDERQLSCLQLSEVIQDSYLEILAQLKIDLKYHNLDSIIKSGFVLCGGGSEVESFEELVRDFFTRRVKMGSIQRSMISGFENVLSDYRYTGAIGLLLHDEDLNQSDLSLTISNKGVIGKLKKWTSGGF